jgi:hypothetical protein
MKSALLNLSVLLGILIVCAGVMAVESSSPPADPAKDRVTLDQAVMQPPKESRMIAMGVGPEPTPTPCPKCVNPAPCGVSQPCTILPAGSTCSWWVLFCSLDQSTSCRKVVAINNITYSQPPPPCPRSEPVPVICGQYYLGEAECIPTGWFQCEIICNCDMPDGYLIRESCAP